MTKPVTPCSDRQFVPSFNRRSVARMMLGGAILTSVAPLAGCGLYPTYSFNYALKIRIVTDGVEHVGASVFKIAWYVGFGKQFGGSWADVYVYGDAVTLNFGKKGLLFGLINPPNTKNGFDIRAILQILPTLPPAELNNYGSYENDYGSYESVNTALSRAELNDYDSYKSGEIFRHAEAILQREIDVPPEWWPVFMRFTNINDPRSAQIVRPDHLGTIYGALSEPPRVTVKISRDPVTRNIDHYLPWLMNTKGAFLHQRGPAAAASIAALTTRYNFRRDGESY